MIINEEKILMLCNELEDEIEEKFYLIDKEYNSDNCNYILCIISKLFIKKNMFILFNKLMKEFIDKCFEKIEDKEIYDYTFITNHLDYLLNDLITVDDINELKSDINEYLGIEENKPVLHIG